MKTYEQLENEKFVFVDNKFFTKEYQEQYGIASILILALIQKNLLVRGQYIYNLQYLFDVLDIKKNNSTQQKKIKDCLVQLQKDNIIISDVDISKANNNQLIYVNIDIPETNYTVVYDFELDAIVKCKEENVYNLFNLFTFLKYRIGIKGYCYWNQTDIAYSIGLKSRKVVSRMVDVLEKELKLIITDNVGTKKFKDGSVKESNYMYALNYKGSKELLKTKKEEYKQELIEDGIKITTNKTANEKRSIKGRINYLVSLFEEDSISDDEVEELRQKEEEYYNLIKNDEDLLEKRIDEFVLFNPMVDEVITKEMTTEKEPKHFGKPNPMKKVDYETGEIIETKTGSVNELDNDNLDWLNGVEEKEEFWNEFEKKHNIKKEDTVDVINKYKPESLQFTEEQQEQYDKRYEITDITDDEWLDLLS
ncbi:hypothetical protein [Sporanaerobacter acetigenes]|uniref:Uncharacterized protein n=1 Tax=Sporanaerobacter acetigenes DSM 13106 TaxID=1123281 RepID=A0A1M5RYL3_9FIRM|nr:hypothetical protein [Sporanaerobacter acetigenes]SHH31457.1 hypothetical protein SAMN02745180_00022 [Sporanaerobacter acetigenes DSM 13106]